MAEPNRSTPRVIPLAAGAAMPGLVAQSPSMKRILRIVEKAAASDTTILLNGETGTGKGVLARLIHECSPRRGRPFVPINCGATPEGLLESEFFGYRRGAFTGAVADTPGKFELADGGTVFLDEIGDMSPELQVKVLRVLEEGEFEPVGGRETIRINVRIIAATHRDLEEEVQKGAFREDLFYRLHVIPIVLPPLRERRSDIPFLAEHFLEESARRNRRPPMRLSAEALEALVHYPWYGNVRELRNLIERLVVLKEGDLLGLEDLPEKIRAAHPLRERRRAALPAVEGISLPAAVQEFEKALIRSALEKAGGVKYRAAELLQIKRTTLLEKIKRYQLDGLVNES